MLGIGFAMLIIDLPVSNPLLFFFDAWYTITDGNFLMCPSLDAFNAMGNLVGSPPLLTNETTLTLEHVMERLDAIEKKMLTEENIEKLDKRMHNLANRIG